MTTLFSKAVLSLVLLFGTTFLIGCNGSKSATPAVEMTDAEINLATNFIPGTLKESEALVKLIEAAVADQDVMALEALFDQEQLVNRVLAGLDVSSKSRSGFVNGFRNGGAFNRFSNEILNAVRAGGNYTFVRMVTNGDEYRPLFRLTMPEMAGVNYHELLVSRDSTNKPRIADMNIYLSGEPISQTMRRLVLPALVADNAGIVERLAKNESDLIKNYRSIEAINSLIQSRNFQQAMKTFETLPESLQQDKSMLVLKLVIAQNLDESVYTQVLLDLERLFPDDPAREFRSVDLYLMQGKHDEVVKCMDRLLATTQDPYLNLLKIDSLIALNRADDARDAFAKGKEAGGATEDVGWIEVALLLGLEDYSGIARTLDRMAQEFGTEFGDLNTVPEYAGFVASEEGKAWMAKQN